MTRKQVSRSYRAVLHYFLRGEGRTSGAALSIRWAKRTAKRLGIRV